MSDFVSGARPGTTAAPLPGQPSTTARAGSPAAGLRALLIALTGVTGVVDAASYLGVGHVFVANMTGNVVLLGFALSGATGVSIAASLVALAGFLAGAGAGAGAGGRLAVASSPHRRLWLSTAWASWVPPWGSRTPPPGTLRSPT